MTTFKRARAALTRESLRLQHIALNYNRDALDTLAHEGFEIWRDVLVWSLAGSSTWPFCFPRLL
jgi:hypothetical protein